MTDDILEPQAPPAEVLPAHDEPEPELVVENDSELEPPAAVEPEVASAPESESEDEPATDPDSAQTLEAELELDSEVEQEDEYKGEPAAELESEAAPEAEPKPDSDENPEGEGEPAVASAPEPEAEFVPEAERTIETDSVQPFAVEPESEAVPEAEVEPEIEPKEPSLTATLRFPVPAEAPESDAASGQSSDSVSDTTATLDAPRLRDVLAAFAGWARAVPRRCGRVLARHRILVAVLALACVGLVLAGVLFGMRRSQTPSDGLITSDARERLVVPTMAASDYALDEPLVFSSLDIKEKHASASRNDACDVALVARFANAAVEAIADATLTYVRDEGDAWSCTAASTDDVSFRATAGVSTDAVMDHVDTLLRAAGSDEDEGEQLAELYRGAEVEFVGERFNEEQQTDSLTLHCSSGSTFMSRECDLTAHFRFVPASGAWELSEARVSDGAFELGFQPLVGTWEGTFLSQQAKGGKCLGARESGLTLVIAKASVNKDGVAIIEGALSGLAHLHDPLETDVEACADDELLESVPFAGTLRTANDTEDDLIGLFLGPEQRAQAGGIVFDCVTQDLAHGTVSLTLDLGSGDDPDAATATLISEHPYEETFAIFWTFDATTRYEDHFSLKKVS